MGEVMTYNDIEQAVRRRTRYWWMNEIKGVHLYAMRSLRKKTPKQVAKMIHEDEWYLKRLEKETNLSVPPPIAGKYMIALSITPSHMAQFNKIMKGELKTFSETRTITSQTKEKVRKKHKNRCGICKDDKDLHFHHKQLYSKGGQNIPENLILLCRNCHAKEHESDGYSNLIKFGGRVIR